jgi:hypothetical protein
MHYGWFLLAPGLDIAACIRSFSVIVPLARTGSVARMLTKIGYQSVNTGGATSRRPHEFHFD